MIPGYTQHINRYTISSLCGTVNPSLFPYKIVQKLLHQLLRLHLDSHMIDGSRFSLLRKWDLGIRYTSSVIFPGERWRSV